MTLSIVCPTIPGREAELERTVETYERLTPVPIEWIIETGYPTCAHGWNAMVPKATGEILHLAADDLEPETDRWFSATLEAISHGRVPLGWVDDVVYGKHGCDFCRVWAGRREWYRNVPEIHYYSDNILTDMMIADGHPPEIIDGFDFYHRHSFIGRLESPERMYADSLLYERWASSRTS